MKPGRLLLAFYCAMTAGCAEVGVQQGCNPDELKARVVEASAADEVACVQFSIDATQEPGTFHAPSVLSTFPFDPAHQFRLTPMSTSVDWRDGPVAATPEAGWTGWRSVAGWVDRWTAVCPRARMYQAVCAPSGALDHCEAVDGRIFRPDEIGAVTCFANDSPRRYSNNSGCVAVRLCKIRE